MLVDVASLDVVLFAVVPDKLKIAEEFLILAIFSLAELLSCCLKIHRLLDDLRVIKEAKFLPRDRLSELVALRVLFYGRDDFFQLDLVLRSYLALLTKASTPKWLNRSE